MKKRTIAAIAGSIGIGVLAGNMVRTNMYKGKTRFSDDEDDLCNKDEVVLEQAGTPDQVDGYDYESLLENSTMVSEGSQFGVQYYNETRGEAEPNYKMSA